MSKTSAPRFSVTRIAAEAFCLALRQTINIPELPKQSDPPKHPLE